MGDSNRHSHAINAAPEVRQNLEEAKGITDTSVSKSGVKASSVHADPSHISRDLRLQNQSWSRKLNPLKRDTLPPVPTHRGISGEHEAGTLSRLYFSWMVPLLSTGYQRPLELTDIWNVNPDRSVDTLATKFKAALQRRRLMKLSTRFDPITLALYDTFTADFVVGGLCQLVAGVIQVMSPFVLKYLIYFVQAAYDARYRGGDAPGVANGVGLVVGIACMQVLQSLCVNHSYYRGMILGGQARSVLIACIFEKSLKLSGRAKAGGDDRDGWSNGQINNLMSTDTSRIDLASVMLHRCWVAPIQITLALVLLCINLTYSALVGFGLICTIMPLLARAIKALMVRRKTINKLTDQRIQLTQDSFNSIRFVKLFAWEPKLLSRLASIRTSETSQIAKLQGVRNAFLATAFITPILASMLTFITYSLSGHVLEAAPIFSSLALFNAINLPLEILPLAIGRLVDALAAAKRVSQFLDAEELKDEFKWDHSQVDTIQIDHASFSWEQAVSDSSKSNAKIPEQADSAASREEPFSIRNIDLSVGRREFIAVIGSIGSGKSSLIAALAGEMRQTEGSVTFSTSKALCSQTPWIQNATLRQNITFGKDYDPDFYNIVVHACALRRDIELLPQGDLTEIGEKGVTLSGGQKQRLNIARAIYSNADIILMDDPLSAVDAHVGQHMLEHAICGLLQTKCRILATHQLHVLHRADTIVWMKDGGIHKRATFTDLMRDDLEFQQLMKTSSHEQEKPEEVSSTHNLAPSNQVSAKKDSANAIALMQEEERSTGSVGLSVYAAFIRASGSVLNLLVVVLVLILAQGSNILTSLWLSWWTYSRFPGLAFGTYMGVYAALGVTQAILVFGYATTLTTLSTRAAKNMLTTALGHTMGAPMLFFDTTPIGRIINRFSKDVDTMDNRLTDNLRFLLYIIATIVSVFCLVTAYFYYFVVALVPLIIAFLLAASYYRSSAREIKRHEAVLRSVVFAQFAESLAGSATIRAYGVQNQFVKKIFHSLDSMDGAYFLTFAGQRWLSTRLDTLGSLLIFVVGILIITSRFEVNPSISGVILAYMLSIVQLVQVLVHTYADVEDDMNSVERLHYYSHKLEQEEPAEKKHLAVRETWPEKGELEFKDVQMRYRPGLPLALKGLCLNVRSGERIGIIGRTGAGKSSIISAIFRLVELAEGSIVIDGVDIAALALHDLRSRLSIIPQDPTLFKGTVRTNLDPFDEYDDSRLWSALRQAGLVDGKAADATDKTINSVALDSPVESEGHNYSLGQRQLLTLARILVKDCQIIMFDEATSSVDFEKDKEVQETILRAFGGKTVLCIAHRLKTIIGYDRILVLDAGQIAECDDPVALYDDNGIFHSMCRTSGISREEICLQRSYVEEVRSQHNMG